MTECRHCAQPIGHVTGHYWEHEDGWQTCNSFQAITYATPKEDL